MPHEHRHATALLERKPTNHLPDTALIIEALGSRANYGPQTDEITKSDEDIQTIEPMPQVEDKPYSPGQEMAIYYMTILEELLERSDVSTDEKRQLFIAIKPKLKFYLGQVDKDEAMSYRVASNSASMYQQLRERLEVHRTELGDLVDITPST